MKFQPMHLLAYIGYILTALWASQIYPITGHQVAFWWLASLMFAIAEVIIEAIAKRLK